MITTTIHRFSCYFEFRTVVHMESTHPRPHHSPDATTIPAPDAVVALYRAVQRDGLAAHGDRLEQLRLAAADVGADAPLVHLIRDPTAPDAIRIRAIARLANQWSDLTAPTVDGSVVARTFAALLARWNAHQDLRAAGAGPAELSISRRELDGARRAHRAARRAGCLGSTA